MDPRSEEQVKQRERKLLKVLGPALILVALALGIHLYHAFDKSRRDGDPWWVWPAIITVLVLAAIYELKRKKENPQEEKLTKQDAARILAMKDKYIWTEIAAIAILSAAYVRFGISMTMLWIAAAYLPFHIGFKIFLRRRTKKIKKALADFAAAQDYLRLHARESFGPVYDDMAALLDKHLPPNAAASVARMHDAGVLVILRCLETKNSRLELKRVIHETYGDAFVDGLVDKIPDLDRLHTEIWKGWEEKGMKSGAVRGRQQGFAINMSGTTVLDSPTDTTTQTDDLYRVILHNDDVNTAAFVVKCLKRVFGHSESKAFEIMMEAHTRGLAIAEVEAEEPAKLHRDQLQSYGLTASVEKT